MNDITRSTIEGPVKSFVQGTKTMLAGRFLNNQSLYLRGLSLVEKAIQTLDATSIGRDPLLTLLDHNDEMVRTIAGAALWQSHTDQARRAIEQVDSHGITEASMLAWKILLFHGRYNPVSSDPRFDGLYDGEHDEQKALEPGFTGRAMRGELPSTFALIKSPIESKK